MTEPHTDHITWAGQVWGEKKLAKMVCSGSLTPHLVNIDYVTAEIIIALRMPIRRRSLDLGLQCAVHLYGFHPCSRGHYCCCDQAVSAASASRGEGRIAWSHHGRSHPWQGHVEEPWRARWIMAQGTPWICLSIYPKTRICLSYYFVPFTNSSDINRGLPPTTFLWKKST